MDLFHFEFIPDKEIKMPVKITHESQYTILKDCLSTESSDLTCDYQQGAIRIFDESVSEGDVTISCYLKVARHVE